MRFPSDAEEGGSYDERGRKEKVGKEEVRGREKGSWPHGLTREEKREERKSEGGRVDEERRRYLVED